MSNEANHIGGHGILCHHETGVPIRRASRGELIASLDAVNGAITIDGNTVYVEWDAPSQEALTALQSAAAYAGDASMHDDCTDALAGDGAAIVHCDGVIAEAAAA